MREVERDRFVPESPTVVARALSPERIVEWEGSFSVVDVAEPDAANSDTGAATTGTSNVERAETSDTGTRTAETPTDRDGNATLVTVSGPGVGFRLRFERTPDGYHYLVPDGDDPAGPFDHMESWLSVDPENEGSRVRIRSVVSLNAPLPFADRIAAWKRGGELDRTLDGLADAV